MGNVPKSAGSGGSGLSAQRREARSGPDFSAGNYELRNSSNPAHLGCLLDPNWRKSLTRQLPLPKHDGRFRLLWEISPKLFEIAVVCGEFAQ